MPCKHFQLFLLSAVNSCYFATECDFLYLQTTSTTLYCLVLEYAGGGDLHSHVKQSPKGHLSESEARPLVRQLVSALHFIHQRNVVHRCVRA